uniref:Uncharacterized protein n=1 Tax=Romanomermis culicivorax TaxID=13658 RepID=A0A915L0P8_ROMCU
MIAQSRRNRIQSRQAKSNFSKDYGFLVNEPTIRIKTLIEGWIWKGFLGGSYAQNVLRSFNRTLGKKGRGSFFSEMSSLSEGMWNTYQFVSARTADDRLSGAYAF